MANRNAPESPYLDDVPTQRMQRPASAPDADRTLETVPGFVPDDTDPDMYIEDPVHTVRDPEVSGRVSYIESLIQIELRDGDEPVQSSEPPTPRVRVA